MYRITYKAHFTARGHFIGTFETVVNSPEELEIVLKSLRADPDVFDIEEPK